MRAAPPLFVDRVPSPLGRLFIVHDADGHLRALDFPDYEPRLHRLLRLHYGAFDPTPSPAPRATVRALDAFFAGDLEAIDTLPVRTGGTEFQRRVWAALRRIPAGTTISYGQLAATIGRSDAVRAVGLANGANPVAVVVPCHRVIGTDGGLTGYGGGIERKSWLLTHERACAGRRRQSA
jgi:methylated-DNA-[protein]-cysteine S-methyltransferase